MSGIDFASTSISSYQCNLADKLYVPGSLFEHKLNGHWIIFVPDQPGLPLVIEEWMYDVMHHFRKGARVSDILKLLQEKMQMPQSFDKIYPVICVLKEKGFLRAKPFELPYEISEVCQHSKPSAFSVWLHITNNCNLNCSYCFVKKDSRKTAMSSEVMQSTADAIAYTAKKHKIKTVHIKFAGGEPTLAIPIMEYFHDRDC